MKCRCEWYENAVISFRTALRYKCGLSLYTEQQFLCWGQFSVSITLINTAAWELNSYCKFTHFSIFFQLSRVRLVGHTRRLSFLPSSGFQFTGNHCWGGFSSCPITWAHINPSSNLPLQLVVPGKPPKAGRPDGILIRHPSHLVRLFLSIGGAALSWSLDVLEA